MKSLEYSNKAIQRCLSAFGENHRETTMSYNNVGAVLVEMGDYNKAMDYRLKAIEIAHSINDADLEAKLQNLVGKTCLKMGDVGKARERFMQAAEIFRKIGNEKELNANLELYRSLASENES